MSFLISENPVSVEAASSVLGKAQFHSEMAKGNSRAFPAYVDREQALRIAHAFDCVLPTELQWEYACRGGAETLFPWGDALLPNSQLGRWMDYSMDNPQVNGFGLKWLFTGDWCQDPYRTSHEPDAVAKKGEYVIKGGGSCFWPWQDAGEWVWCMPAMRMPSSDLIDGKCAFRLVKDLESAEK
jgi:hypothetical protein